MKRRGRRVGAPTIILLTVFLIVAGIALLNFFATRNTLSSHIVLPKDADTPAQIGGGSDDYIFVTRENVLDVVASLSRPVAFHQSLVSVISDEDAQSETAVELWTYGNVKLITTSTADAVRRILTDGSTAYIWYDINPLSVTKMVLPPDMSSDDLSGIPTYESLLRDSPDRILTAGYVQLEAPFDNPCVFAHVQRGELGTETDWIDTASGLLCRAEFEKNGEVFGTIEQTALELIDVSDAAVRSVFYLPDGSEPFSVSSAVEMPQA